MSTDVTDRNLDDVKLSVLGLLASLWNAGQVVLAPGSDAAECDMERALEILTEGGALHVTFAPPSCRATVEEMKRFIKSFDRGNITKEELMNTLQNCSRHIVEAVRHSSDSEPWVQSLPVTELDRILSLLFDTDDCAAEFSDDCEGSNSHLPEDYVIERCRCAVTLMERLVCRNEQKDMSQQRMRLAATLAVATTCDGLLMTDAFHNELRPTEIQAIVRYGGAIRLSALSSADAKLLAKVRNLIDDWYRDRLCNRTLCRQLKACLNKVNLADADWWDRFYSRLTDLWIVAFGKSSKKARASETGKATREEIRSLLDEIEQLVHAPLSRLAR